MSLWLTDTTVQELRPNTEEADLQVLIRAVYKQVLGNVHLMDSQRLASAESQFRNGEINVRNFVRAVALSDLYRTLFFEGASAYQFIELNFKHLLGRAPRDQAEIAEHGAIYRTEGYEAEINSYIDSEEYDLSFGENFVPYYRGGSSLPGANTNGFNRTFALMRGYATSDLGQSAKLIDDLGGNLPTKINFPPSPYKPVKSTEKRFRIAITKNGFGPRSVRSNTSVEVGYGQLSQKIQNIHKTGGRILSITEV